MALKDSTRRALRTAYQAAVAAILVVPIFALWLKDLFPPDSPTTKLALSISGGMIAVTAAASKLINMLEAAGKIPAWLKQPAATAVNPDPEDTPGAHAAPEI